MARTTRRDLLSAGGFTVLAGVAAVAIAKPDAQAIETAPVVHEPDAALIAICRRISAIDDELSATFAGRDYNDPEEVRLEAVRADLMDEQGELLAETHDLHATTLEGHRARARTYLRYYEGVEQTGQIGGYMNDQMVWLLVRDLAGGSV